jgi:hypothetical protein
MKVIGVRNSTDTIRFAVIEKDGTGMHFVNANDENRVILPKNITATADQVVWARHEVNRIIAAHGPVAGIALKRNENFPKAYTQIMATAFLDALWFLAAGENAVPIESYVYLQMGTRSKDVCVDAVKGLAPSFTHWTTQMADAVMGAVHRGGGW